MKNDVLYTFIAPLACHRDLWRRWSNKITILHCIISYTCYYTLMATVKIPDQSPLESINVTMMVRQKHQSVRNFA